MHGSRRSSRDEAVVATIMAGLGVCIRTEAGRVVAACWKRVPEGLNRSNAGAKIERPCTGRNINDIP